MPVIKREDFGTERAPSWCRVEGGIVAMDCWEPEDSVTVEPHFHDCEEFWFVLRGRARVACDGQELEVGPGDVVCTQMGEEHAVLRITEGPYAHVWVATSLRGKGRGGHLHRGTDD